MSLFALTLALACAADAAAATSSATSSAPSSTTTTTAATAATAATPTPATTTATPTAATTTPTAAEPAAPERPKVIILDVGGASVDEETTRIINGMIASLAAENKSADFTTGADLRASLDVEVQRQSAGCSATSCLGELAGALGARYILHGDLGKVGVDTVINLSLFDSSVGNAPAHTTTTLADLSDLREQLRPDVHTLLLPLGGLPPEEAPPPVLTIAGGAVVGVGAVAALLGGGLALAADGVAGDPKRGVAEKQQALRDGALWLVIGGVGAVAAAAGGGLLAYGLVTE